MPVIPDDLIPTSVVGELFDQAATQSVVLQLGRRQPMPTAHGIVPVIQTLPATGWVNGRGGRKPATTIDWTSVHLTPEEVAAVIAIPQAYIDDAGIPIWPAVRNRLAEAIAYSIDSAVLFGVDAPPSFPEGGIVAGASGPFTDPDISIAVANAMSSVEDRGVGVTGHAAAVTVRGALRLLRNAAGDPVLLNSVAGGALANQLYGYDVAFSNNGAFDTETADLITGNWNMLVVGVRQDMSFDMSEDAVLTDAAGVVVANAFQDDLVVMRVHMRLGVVVGSPVTRISEEPVYPFALVKRAAGTGGGA